MIVRKSTLQRAIREQLGSKPSDVEALNAQLEGDCDDLCVLAKRLERLIGNAIAPASLPNVWMAQRKPEMHEIKKVITKIEDILSDIKNELKL